MREGASGCRYSPPPPEKTRCKQPETPPVKRMVPVFYHLRTFTYPLFENPGAAYGESAQLSCGWRVDITILAKVIIRK